MRAILPGSRREVELGSSPLQGWSTTAQNRVAFRSFSSTPPRALALLFVALQLGGCSGGAGGTDSIENVLLVTFDTTRADRLGCTGWPSAHTPVLDALAERGVLFDRCIAAAPITLPSHATILTGLQPYHHGARNNGTHHLPPEVVTIAETLADADFATGAVISAVVLDSRFGLDQGFQHYDDDLSSAKSVEEFVYRQVDAQNTASRAIRWLEERGEERWFLWVHFFDPHADYAPPARFLELCDGSAYDGEIAYADAELGRVLQAVEARGEIERTLVVMTADHGESLGEHGEQTHSLFLYDATTRVPLVFAHPTLIARKRVEDVVSSADVVPTLLELLDLAPPRKVDGDSLARVLREPAASPRPTSAYSEALAPLFNHGWSDLRALRDRGTRYIRAPRPELYELESDPGENVNLLPEADARAEAHRALLDALLPEREADAQGGDGGGVDPDLRHSIDELGYASSGEGGTLEDAEQRPDPKDKVADWEKTLVGWGMVRAGWHERALEVFRAVIAKDPSSVNARQGLVTALRDLDRFDEALVELRALVALPSPGPRSFVLLGEVQRKLGSDEWRQSLARAKELDPRDAQPWTREGDWSAEAGDFEGAERAYRRALELDERDADAWLGLANLAHERGRDDEAESLLRRAIEADPLSRDAWFSMGVQCEVMNRPEQALENYERAVHLDPKDATSLVKIGNLHLRAGRSEPARAAYERAIRIEPEDFTAHYNLGQLDFQEGRNSDAAEHFAIACRVDPSQAEVWRRLMMARRATKELPAAAEAAERLLALLPDDLQGLMTSAVALAALGKEELARERLLRALELDPDRVRARSQQDEELAALLARLPRR